MVKVSVIIPVYNIENYLDECITSLLKQTLTDCEFIFVNDGSKDNSQRIIQEYQKKDARIILVNQKNQGVSIARNNGIQIAKGKYLGFVDGDDYLAEDMYQVLFNIAEQTEAGITCSNFITEQGGMQITSVSPFSIDTVYDKNFVQQNIMPYLIREDGLNSSCNKLYRSDMILNNEIFFPKGMANGEDALFNLKAFNSSSKVVFADYAGYYYREVEGSATRNLVSKKYFENALKMYHFDYKGYINLSMPENEIKKMQAIRFVETVIALIHIYLKPNRYVSYVNRSKEVKEMINNEELQSVIQNYSEVIFSKKDRYRQFVLNCVKNKSMLGLVLATQYSNFRNKK